MTRRKSASLVNPFLAWSDLAWKSGEMMLASAQVISERTRRMANASTPPSRRDQKEFSRMGSEKLEAAIQSATAMAKGAMAANPMLAPKAMKQMANLGAATAAVTASRTLGQFVAAQDRLGKLMLQSMQTATAISGTTADIAKRGLKPIHTKARANAKRLRKG